MKRVTPILACISSAVALAAGCAPVTTLNTRADPSVTILARTQGGVDTVNNCTPASPAAPPTPSAWWNGLAPGQPPKLAGQGTVGFDLWRNQTGNCQEFRQDLYRTAFTYDLASLQRLKGLVTKAQVSFNAAIIPATRPNSMCQSMTGAGGSLLALPPGTVLPASSFAQLAPSAVFPGGARLMAMTFPWVEGPLGTNASTARAAPDRATFTVDVTDQVVAALDRGDAKVGFVLSGSDEARPAVPPPNRFDCRTVYQIGQLVLTHL